MSAARILIVDDEPSLVDFLTVLCGAEGWEPTAALSVREARERLAERTPDLVLCDIMMPGGSGIDFYDEAVKRHPAMAKRVVFLTALAQEDEILQKVEARGVPLLSKLYELDLAIDAVAVAVLTQ